MSRRPLAIACALLAAACADRAEEAAPAPADPLGALVLAHRASVPGNVLGADVARPTKTSLRVLVAGDLIPHRPSLASAAAIGSALAPLAPLFGKADAAIANYEAATARGSDLPTRKMTYAAPPDWLPELRRSGLTGLTVANNHACDLDLAGVDTTLGAARDAGLATFGGDEVDPWAPRVVAEANGHRVCAVAWTTQMNSEGACARGKHLAIASPRRRARVDAALARAAAGCDATIAIIHGGHEYTEQTETMMDLAAHAAERGADAVVLHHPHVVSPVTLHTTRTGRRVPLFASVGNLASNQGESWTPDMFPVLPENRRLVCVNAWTRLGMIADLAFGFEGTERTLEWGYHLVWTENEHATNRAAVTPRIAVRLVDPERDRALVAKLGEDRRGPGSVFEDPCWIGDPGSEDARAHRCRGRATLGAPVAPRPASKASPVKAPARARAPEARRNTRKKR